MPEWAEGGGLHETVCVCVCVFSWNPLMFLYMFADGISTVYSKSYYST